MRGQEQIQAEAHSRNEREKVARRFGLLTEDSQDLLVELGHRDAKLALVVGQALARERDQALANQKRAEQERSIQAAKARGLGAELGYPAVDALDLGEGEDHWRTYLANPKHPLEPLFAEIAKLAEKIKTIQVELYLRVENNTKYVRGKGKVRDEIERYILRQYAMGNTPMGSSTPSPSPMRQMSNWSELSTGIFCKKLNQQPTHGIASSRQM